MKDKNNINILTEDNRVFVRDSAAMSKAEREAKAMAEKLCGARLQESIDRNMVEPVCGKLTRADLMEVVPTYD